MRGLLFSLDSLNFCSGNESTSSPRLEDAAESEDRFVDVICFALLNLHRNSKAVQSCAARRGAMRLCRATRFS